MFFMGIVILVMEKIHKYGSLEVLMTDYKPSVNFPRIPNNITVKFKKFKPQPLELTLCFLPTH